MLKGIKVPASRISCCARDVSLCERFFFSSPFQRMNPGIKGFYETFFGSWIRDAEGIEFAINVPTSWTRSFLLLRTCFARQLL